MRCSTAHALVVAPGPSHAVHRPQVPVQSIWGTAQHSFWSDACDSAASGTSSDEATRNLVTSAAPKQMPRQSSAASLAQHAPLRSNTAGPEQLPRQSRRPGSPSASGGQGSGLAKKSSGKPPTALQACFATRRAPPPRM